MRNDRVLIRVLPMAQDAKCFHLVYTGVSIDNYPDKFILSQKCQRLDYMSIK